MSRKSEDVSKSPLELFQAGGTGMYWFPIQDGEKYRPQINVQVRYAKRKGGNRMYLDVIDIEKGHAFFRAWKELRGEDAEDGDNIWINFPPRKGKPPERIPRAKKYFLQALQRYFRAIYEGKRVDDWAELPPASDNFSRRDMTVRTRNIRPPRSQMRVVFR